MADLESSAGSNATEDTTQVASSEAVTQDVAPAESSTAEGEQPASTLEAVRAALHPEKPDEASPPSQTQGLPSDKPEPQQVAEQSTDGLTPEEKAQLKGKTRHAFERLVRNNAEHVKAIEARDAEIASLKTRTAEYDKVLDYIKQTKLTPEDLDNGIGIMSLIKQGRPHEAYERLVPIVSQLQRIIGLDLPADLQEQVRAGYLTEQHARELASSRSRAHFSDLREKESREAQTVEAQQATRHRMVQDAATAAENWERQKQAKDPDWSKKSGRVQDLVKLEVFEKGYPTSGAAVVEMLERVHKRVTDEIRSFQPKPNGVRPPPNGQASARSVAEPKTMLEAIRQGLHSNA